MVEHGATLKLILALRGGPINTRRIPLPPSSAAQERERMREIPPELKELMRMNHDQILERMPENGQVSGVYWMQISDAKIGTKEMQ